MEGAKLFLGDAPHICKFILTDRYLSNSAVGVGAGLLAHHRHLAKYPALQGVQDKLWGFQEFFIILPPLPRKHWAAIGCAEFGQPIGVTVHSHCVESFENLLQRYVGEGLVEEGNENAFFLEYISL